MKKLDARGLTTMALLVAMMVILSQVLGIETQFLKITFTFIPEMVMGMLFGPLWTAMGASLADVVGMMLFAKAAFFIGFTINAFIGGLIYGFFFYKKEVTLKNTILCVTVITIVINLCLTPLWLALMYNVPLNSWQIWGPRLFKTAFGYPTQIMIMYVVGRMLPYKQWTARFAR